MFILLVIFIPSFLSFQSYALYFTIEFSMMMMIVEEAFIVGIRMAIIFPIKENKVSKKLIINAPFKCNRVSRQI